MLRKENYGQEIPVWIAEGEKDLTDNGSIWKWLKYNIRAHAIQYSIKKTQEEYSRVCKIYENDSNDINADRLNAAKERLESFYEEKVKKNNYSSKSSLARTQWKKYLIFPDFRKKEIMLKNICEN